MPPTMTAGGGRQLGKLLGLWLDVVAGTWFDTGMETTPNTVLATHRLLGVNSDHDTCTACGKTGLKRVAWIAEVTADGEAGDPAAYGTDCAGMILHGRKSAANTDRVTRIGRLLATASRWLAEGHPADKVAVALWDRYGYTTEARDGEILVRSGGMVHVATGRAA